MTEPRRFENAPLPKATDLRKLSQPLGESIRALFMYKSFFVGDWFTLLLESQRESHQRDVLERVRSETAREAMDALSEAQDWSRFPFPEERADELLDLVQERAVQDMIRLKESSTELFIAAGMHAPTEDLRRAFLKLGDVDRRHAEMLREMKGPPTSARDVRSATAREPRGVPAIDTGPFPAGGVDAAIKRTVDAFRESGEAPERIVMSGQTYRRVRDEAPHALDEGRVHGLVAEVDVAWSGDAFVVLTGSRVSLAEVSSEAHARARVSTG